MFLFRIPRRTWKCQAMSLYPKQRALAITAALQSFAANVSDRRRTSSLPKPFFWCVCNQPLTFSAAWEGPQISKTGHVYISKRHGQTSGKKPHSAALPASSEKRQSPSAGTSTAASSVSRSCGGQTGTLRATATTGCVARSSGMGRPLSKRAPGRRAS